MKLKTFYFQYLKVLKRFLTKNHTRAQEIPEFKLTKPRKSFSFEPYINLGLGSKWIISITSLEVYIFF